MSRTVKVLFVCIGNSCRSPMAESVLKGIIDNGADKSINWHVDSAALADWNVGYPPEERCIQVLQENNLTSSHIGRQITVEDFLNFDHIFGMDNSNIYSLKICAPEECINKIELLGKYGNNPNDHNIQDPYFDEGVESFRVAYSLIEPACRNFYNLQLSHN